MNKHTLIQGVVEEFDEVWKLTEDLVFNGAIINKRDFQEAWRNKLRTTLQSQADEYEKVREQERIICAAVRASDGYVFRGQWHATAMYAPFGLQGMPKYKDEKPHGDDQGFVTSLDRYVTREEAWEIAKAAGQLNSRDHQEGELYSEDLMYAEPVLTKSTV